MLLRKPLRKSGFASGHLSANEDELRPSVHVSILSPNVELRGWLEAGESPL